MNEDHIPLNVLGMHFDWLFNLPTAQAVILGVLANFVFFVLGSWIGKPLWNSARSVLIYIAIKSPKLAMRYDPFWGQYGDFFIFRRGASGVNKIYFKVYRSRFSVYPIVEWHNPGLFPENVARGKLQRSGPYFRADLRSHFGTSMTIIYQGVGLSYVKDFRFGIQSGISIVNQSIYSCRILITSKDLSPDDLLETLTEADSLDFYYTDIARKTMHIAEKSDQKQQK